MSIDKTELQRTIIYYLKERQPESKNELLLNNSMIFEYLGSVYSLSKSTIEKWYKENREFKNVIDETVKNDLMLGFENNLF